MTIVEPQASPAPATTDWVPLGNTGSVPTTSPSAHVFHSVAQSVPNAAMTYINFDTVRYDRGPAPHWVAGSPTRLTCQVAGTYQILGTLQYNTVAGGGVRWALIFLNGNVIAVGGAGPSTILGSPNADVQVSGQWYLNVGDYVELVAYQDSGGAINVQPSTVAAGGWFNQEFSMALLGGQQGPIGPPGVGVPTPVVNGQWIKGVGGAAVWQPIAQADLPTNLQANVGSSLVSDCNAATNSGWYGFNTGASNSPDGGAYFMLEVTQFNGHVRQTAYQLNSDRKYVRRLDAGVGWTPWRPSYAPGVGYEPGGLAGSGYCKIQAGQTNVAIGTAADNNPITAYINLPVAWTNSHYAFIGMGWPGGNWGVKTVASLPNGVSQGMVAFMNTIADQTMTISWISFGF